MNTVYLLINLFLPYGFLTIIIFSLSSLSYFLISEHIRIKRVKDQKIKKEKPKEEVLKRWRKIRKIRRERETK